MAYIVMIDADIFPLTKTAWTVDQSFEAEFHSLEEAEMYVRSLERWSENDADDELWAAHRPVFKIYCEELNEFV